MPYEDVKWSTRWVLITVAAAYLLTAFWFRALHPCDMFREAAFRMIDQEIGSGDEVTFQDVASFHGLVNETIKTLTTSQCVQQLGRVAVVLAKHPARRDDAMAATTKPAR